MIKIDPYLQIDTGSGFNENQIITGKIDDHKKKGEFDLSGINKINRLRFHPADVFTIVKIKNITVTRSDESKYEPDYYKHNAVHRQGRIFYFSTSNPFIEILLFNQDIQKISFDVEYTALGEDSIDYTLAAILKTVDDAGEDETRKHQVAEKKWMDLIHSQATNMSQLKSQIKELELNVEAAKTTQIKPIKIILTWLKTLYRWTLLENRPLKKKLLAFPIVLGKEYSSVKKSGLFDSAYYLDRNPDVKAMRVNALEHYLSDGYKEGKNPNVLFDSSYYLKQNPEITSTGMNPLAHFLEKGAKEGKNPCPLFNTKYYLDRNSDIEESGINPLYHYLIDGFKEGKDPNPFFESNYYLKENPDVAESGMNQLSHFISTGYKEKRNPGPHFTTAYYQDKYEEELKNTNPLEHFLEIGQKKGYYPNRRFERFTHLPKISIITPVYNINENFLHKCIRSVINQIYFNWELCLVDDGSDKKHIKPILNKYAEKDSRIKVKILPTNKGVAEATNEGVRLASGEYLGFLDHDDELTKEALFQVAKSIDKKNPNIIYTDEDIINEKGTTVSSLFKPDFSPDLLLSNNYITHFYVLRKKLFDEVGGFSKIYDGAQDYDLILKSSEKTNNILHIHEVLYHWRGSKSSTSANPEIKAYAHDAGKLAIGSALRRRKIAGKVLNNNRLFHYRVKRKLKHHPLISIVIPFKDQGNYLKQCIDAIMEKSTYRNFEIIGINNGSENEETLEVIERLKGDDDRIKFYGYPIPFNYSKLNNLGVGRVNGIHVVLMNNDIEIMNSDWIEALLEHSQRKEVGAVGAKLFYPDGTIQHAGVILGIGGFAGHSHRFFDGSDPGYYYRLMSIQNVSAVTGALMMVKTRLYQTMGGLVEEDFAVALNDVDFCLRLRRKGYLNIFTPFCQAIHHESLTRGYEETPANKKRFSGEIRKFKKLWKKQLLKGDPYYNRNLTLMREDFSIKKSTQHAIV